jgi:hydrogenase small subunit
MNITRRQFLQYCTASAAALGLSQTDLLKLEKALAAGPCPDGVNDPTCYGVPHVIWFQGQSCGGCTLSILNRMRIDVDLTGESGLGGSGEITWNALPPMGQYVQDVVDLLVGDAVGALTTGVRTGWANFPNGYICLDYQSEVMAGAGALIAQYIECLRDAGEPYFVGLSGAVPSKDDKLINKGQQPFCVSGSFDTGDGGGRKERSIGQILQWLATGAGFSGLVSFGTCASWGGIPAAKRNRTEATSAYNYLVNLNGLGDVTTSSSSMFPGAKLKDAIINVPGCAPHPDWMIWPIAYIILTGNLPPLDTDTTEVSVWKYRPKKTRKWKRRRYIVPRNTPRAIYTSDKGYSVFCEVCEKYSTTQTCNDLGAGPGDGDGLNQKEWCTRPQGCNGFMAHPDCPTRRWNNFDDHTRNQWCVGTLPSGSNYVCQGCAESDFPDGRSPFFSGVKNGA